MARRIDPASACNIDFALNKKSRHVCAARPCIPSSLAYAADSLLTAGFESQKSTLAYSSLQPVGSFADYYYCVLHWLLVAGGNSAGTGQPANHEVVVYAAAAQRNFAHHCCRR